MGRVLNFERGQYGASKREKSIWLPLPKCDGFFERRDPSECRGHRVFRLGPDLLKKFGKFTGKYPRWSLFLNSAAS